MSTLLRPIHEMTEAGEAVDELDLRREDHQLPVALLPHGVCPILRLLEALPGL